MPVKHPVDFLALSTQWVLPLKKEGCHRSLSGYAVDDTLPYKTGFPASLSPTQVPSCLSLSTTTGTRVDPPTLTILGNTNKTDNGSKSQF
ncbi:MAG: hypothetical protein ACXV2B_03390 [Halobacteriota archaeon]